MKTILIAVTSLDGYIGQTADQPSTTWTSKEDARWFRKKTTEIGVLIVGRPTFETFGRVLPHRLNIVYTREPVVAAQTQGGQILDEQTDTAQIAPGVDHPQAFFTNLEPARLLQKLESAGYDSVALSGGSSIYTLFLTAGLVDQIFLTIEPILFGQGIPLFSQAIQQPVKLVSQQTLNEQVLLLEYRLG